MKNILIKNNQLVSTQNIQLKYSLKKHNKNVGVFLASTILKEQNQHIIDELCDIIKIVLWDWYNVYLFNFGNNENNNIENDIRINKKIYDNLKNYKNLFFIVNKIDIFEIPNLFELFDFNLCLRFHSHIFSVSNNIPFISFNITQKVDNLLNDLKYDYFLKIKKDENDLPLNFNIEEFKILYANFKKNIHKIKEYLINYNNNLNILNYSTVLYNLIFNPIKRISINSHWNDIYIENKIW